MGSLSFDSFHANKEEALAELVKGREIAIRLQTLLHGPVQEHGPVSDSPQHLAFQICRSFSATLSRLGSCTGPTDQIPASASSGESRKKPGVKDRRGCYKRRRSSDSWVIIAPTIEDGCAWRKYGQKSILNSEHPRSYYRCTHKQTEGCKALRQVQRIKEGDEPSYQITYFNHHTCKETLRAPTFLEEPDPVDPTLISFQTSLILPSRQDRDDQRSNPSKPIIIPSIKHEEDHRSASEDVSHEAKSTLEDPWHEITGLEPLGYEPVWSSFQDEVESNALHGLDMEVDQLSGMQDFYYY